MKVSSTTNRRQFLAASAAGAAALSVSPLARTSAAEDESGYIDAHVHVWTPDTQKYPLADGFKKEDMQPPSFTPEELFAHARPAGVTRVVLIQMSFYRYDNSYMLDAIKEYKGVFSGVGVIEETNRPVAAMREMKDQGVRGFRIRPGERGPDAWLAGDGMHAMWKCGADEGLAMCCLINAEFLPSVAAMCKRFPETPVVIDHFARVGVDGTIRARDLDNLCALAAFKHTNVKVSAYYALGRKAAPYDDLIPMIRRCLDAFGPERLMWASDCPFQVVGGHEYRPSIDLIRERMKLSDGDRRSLLRGTAERVFFS